MFLPKGTKLEFAIHRDEDYFENAEQFDGLRFFRMRRMDREKKHHYVTARKYYLGWGVGKSACPGRFLADIEIKLIIAYILLNYDLKSSDSHDRWTHRGRTCCKRPICSRPYASSDRSRE
jgi:cytochrome P450